MQMNSVIENCYCERKGGNLVKCACGSTIHKECMPNDNKRGWQCDRCKAKASGANVGRCMLCETIRGDLLIFQIDESNWVHGRCLHGFFLWMGYQKPAVDPNISLKPVSEMTSDIEFDMKVLINAFLQSNIPIPVDARNELSTMQTFIQTILPQPHGTIRILNENKCFLCSKKYGFMVKCKSPECLTYFHPICFEASSSSTLVNSVSMNMIACPLHRMTARSMKKPRISVVKKEHNTRQTSSIKNIIIQDETILPEIRPEVPIVPSQPVSSRKSSISAIDTSTPTSTPIKEEKSVPESREDDMKMEEETSVQDGEDGEVCDICRYGYSEPGDEMVFCDKCNVAVHQGCYGISTVPEGEWLCAICAHGYDVKNVRCAICLKSGGAMLRTADNKFVHLICVYYTPELSLNLQGPEVLVEGLNRIGKDRRDLICSICGVRGGGCVQCSYRTCSTAFHPYCAQKEGYLLTSDEKGGVLRYVSYCKQHTDAKRAKNAKPQRTSAETTPKKKKRNTQRKKKTKVEDKPAAIPSVILQRMKTDEKEPTFSSVDLWSLVKYFYVIKPNYQYLQPFLHYFSSLSYLFPEAESQISSFPSSIVGYSQTMLDSHCDFPLNRKLELLRPNSLFKIPALGWASLEKRELSVHDDVKVRSFAYHHASNTSLQRTQEQPFQGFDINDFADLRESYECKIDTDLITWAQRHGVCSNTSFRQATKNDIHWLLKLNTINPTFSEEEDYRSTFNEKNEFVIIAERMNEKGQMIPVGMIHYYLMWYYPCNGKQREAVRAVYVCTLQRVTQKTHPEFCAKYGVEGEPLTGTVLLSLAFLHGRQCLMTMGCCDSTDNSVSFYIEQFQMKALPRGNGRHYTPMQLDIKRFDGKNLLMRHINTPYSSTLMCSVQIPQIPLLLNTPKPTSNASLHLQFKSSGELVTVEVVQDHPTIATHDYTLSYYGSLAQRREQNPMQNITDLGHVCEPYTNSWYYLSNDVPHFYDSNNFKRSEPPKDENDMSIVNFVYMRQGENGPILYDESEVEKELEKCQNELYTLMNQNEQGVCALLSKLIHQENESNDITKLVEESSSMHDQLLNYMKEKHPEILKDMEDEEAETICDVCGDGNSDYGNVILYCDGCNAAVHQCCYDLDALPKGDWFCNVCEDILVKQLGVRDCLHVTPKDEPAEVNEKGTVIAESESASSNILDKLHDIRSRVYCCICGFSEGAMMPTLNEGEYAHVACALWHPSCSVTNTAPKCSMPVFVPKLAERKNDEIETPKEAMMNMQIESANEIPLVKEEKVESGSVQVPGVVVNGTINEVNGVINEVNGVINEVNGVINEVNGTNNEVNGTINEVNGVINDVVNALVNNVANDGLNGEIQNKEILDPRIPPPGYEIYNSPYTELRSHQNHNRYLVDTSLYRQQRKGLTCQLCKHRGGVIQCCCSGCSKGIHASCALKYELDMFWNNKIGHSSVDSDEVLVEKDYFTHCFHHSAGFQGREIPRKRCVNYKSPIGEEDSRKKKNDEYVETQETPVRKPRSTTLISSQNQGFERMRKRREKRKEREKKRMNAPGRSQTAKDQLVFTRKAKTKKELKQQIILLWLKNSICAKYLMDNESNVILNLQRKIDSHIIPQYANWKGYNRENATIQAFFRRCKKHGYFQLTDLILEIREIYLDLLSYYYPTANEEEQKIAADVVTDATELTKQVYRLENPVEYNAIMRNPDEAYCICLTRDGTSEFMVGCDECGKWFHPFCIGYSSIKYEGYLTTYGKKYVDVSEENGCFYCPVCIGKNGNAEKMKIYSEEEMLARGASLVPGYHDPEAESVVDDVSVSASLMEVETNETATGVENTSIVESMTPVVDEKMEESSMTMANLPNTESESQNVETTLSVPTSSQETILIPEESKRFIEHPLESESKRLRKE